MDSPIVVVVVWVHSTNNNKSVSSAVKFNCMNYSQTQIWIFNLIRMYYNYKTENCTVRSREYETTESPLANSRRKRPVRTHTLFYSWWCTCATGSIFIINLPCRTYNWNTIFVYKNHPTQKCNVKYLRKYRF